MVPSRPVFVVWVVVFDLLFDCSLPPSCVLGPPAGTGSLFLYPGGVLRDVFTTAPASTLASCMIPDSPLLEFRVSYLVSFFWLLRVSI